MVLFDPDKTYFDYRSEESVRYEAKNLIPVVARTD